MSYLGIIVRAVLVIVFASEMYTQSDLPTFEVVSIKPHASSAPRPLAITTGRRLTATNHTLRQLVLLAYSDQSVPILEQLLVGGPRWTLTDRFDIEGVAADSISLKQSHLMLQSVLSDRFQLRLRREMRELPVYDLVLGKDSKLKLSDDQTPAAPEFSWAGANRRVRGVSGLVLDWSGGVFGGVILRGTAVPLSAVASSLQAWAVDRPVIDKTGLRGLYDVELKLPPPVEFSAIPGARPSETATGTAPVASDPALNPMFESLEEQLGLKLKPGKGLVEVLVIDSVERPSVN